jgi:hypothetical protein
MAPRIGLDRREELRRKLAQPFALIGNVVVLAAIAIDRGGELAGTNDSDAVGAVAVQAGVQKGQQPRQQQDDQRRCEEPDRGAGDERGAL